MAMLFVIHLLLILCGLQGPTGMPWGRTDDTATVTWLQHSLIYRDCLHYPGEMINVITTSPLNAITQMSYRILPVNSHGYYDFQ